PEILAFAPFAAVHESMRDHDALEPLDVVTSGVWMLHDVRDGVAVLTPSPHHRLRDDIGLDRVELRAYASPEATLSAYEEGQIDWTGPLMRDIFAAASDFQRDPTHHVVFLAFDTRRPPFNRADARRALGSLINRQLLAEATGVGAHPALTLIPARSVPGYASIPSTPLDLQTAKTALDTLEGPALVVESAADDSTTRAVLDELSALGFD